jgi:hypothetical protein
MRYSQDFTLTQRDATAALWRFNGDVTDSSGNGHTLTPVNISTPTYQVGYAERGNTALVVPSSGSLQIAGVDANGLNPGVQSFTVELILRCAVDSIIGLIDKWDSATGGYMANSFWGAINFIVKDVLGNQVAQSATFVIDDARWHYIAMVCDRANDELRMYLDGTGSANNPIDISALVGNVNPTDIPVTISNQTNGYEIDEVSILIGEGLTDSAVADRAAGRMNPIMERDDDFFMGFLPAINHDNADLEQFFSPFASQYLEMRLNTMQTGNMFMWHLAPNKLLDAFADTLGFKLIPMRCATDPQRRAFFPWIFWMHQRKGTLAAVNKLLDLSGVTATVVELYSQWIPWKCNRDRTFNRVRHRASQFRDEFDDLLLWETPLSGTWSIVSNECQATGDGTDNASNCMLRVDTERDFYMATKFQITSGFGTGVEFGIYLDWVSTTNWIRLEVRTDGSNNDWLYLVVMNNGARTDYDLADVSAVDHHSGTHTLWVIGYYDAGHYTVGIDGKAYAVRDGIVPIAGFGGKKGLWVNDSLQVTFDDFKVETYDSGLVHRLVSEHTNNKKLHVTLDSAVDNEDCRFGYVREVLPQFIPADVRLTWALSVTDKATLVCSGADPTIKVGVYVTPSPATLVTNRVNPTVILGSSTMTPSPATFRASVGTPGVKIEESVIKIVRMDAPATFFGQTPAPVIDLAGSKYLTPQPSACRTLTRPPNVVIS